MTDYEVANTILRGISAVAALGSVTAILIGLRQMRQSTEERARREDQRHAENMEALRQQGESLRVLIRGMETLIERTSSKRDSQ